MKKMKAYVRNDAASNAIELAEVPIPEVGESEVLVEVRAFGVGVHDRYFIPSHANFPYPIGTEASGIITSIGNKANCLKKNATQVRDVERVLCINAQKCAIVTDQTGLLATN